jgi:chemotaxis protein methyltransferase CheR
MKDSECVAFLQWALPRLGYRWPGFRKVRGQVCKRIRRRLQSLGLGELAEYRKRLEIDANEWAVLDSYCRITISRFYRDKSVFRILCDVVLPDLAERAAADHRDVKCWSAGCACGEEVYTLRLIWDLEIAGAHGQVGFLILGTDVDETVLARASSGCYEAGSLKELPAGLIERCFEQRDDELCVMAGFRNGITFQQQDIRRQMPQGPFDLVLCRNLVLTYFEPALQVRLMREIAARLRARGYFVIGAHESLPVDVTGFEPTVACPQVFQWHG